MRSDKKTRKERALPLSQTEPLGERLPYPGGFPVYLARYVLFRGDEPRAAFRFFNASEILITGIRFRVTEKDADGNVLLDYPLERRGLFAERGTEFSVADAAVGQACASVEVRVTAVLSDPYEYAVEKDGVRLRYGTEERERERYFPAHPSYSVSKRKKRYIAIAFGAVLGAAVLAGALAWRFGVFGQARFDAETAQTAAEEGADYVET